MTRRTLLAAAALLVAACGGSDDDVADTVAPTTSADVTVAPTGPPTVPPTGAPTVPPTDPRPTVGEVVQVVSPGGDVDGQTADSGDAIQQAGVVTTEAAGKIHFSVAEKIETCILRAQGQAVVVPGDGPLVRLVRGEATCRTDPGGGAVEIQAGGVSVLVADPVFRLEVDEGGALTGVGVAQGAVSVNGELLVGGQEASWSGGLGARESVEFDEDLAILGESLPPVRYERPADGQSAVWDGALAQGALAVAVVGGGTPAELTGALLGPFGDVLGAALRVAPTDEEPDVVAESLGDGIALMVTDQPVDGLPTTLLFELDGSSWFVQAPPGEDGVIDAVRDYLAGILQGPCPGGPGEVPVEAGQPVCYVDRYQSVDSEGSVPIDQFAGLLGL